MKINFKKNMKEEQLKQNEEALEQENQEMKEGEVEDFATENQENAPAANEALEKAQNEIKELSDKYLRLVAEFDNFRKRSAKERNELTKNAGEDIIKSLLDVIDDAERAEQQFENSTDVASLKTGIELIFNKLKSILTAKGLSKMQSKGEVFNPELHDAITEIPTANEADSGKVIDEVQTGYYLNDKIIRHAKVVVGK
jgi:molecular chaperone GrpE